MLYYYLDIYIWYVLYYYLDIYMVCAILLFTTNSDEYINLQGRLSKMKWYIRKQHVRCITYKTNVPRDGRIRDYGMVPDGAPCPIGVSLLFNCITFNI